MSKLVIPSPNTNRRNPTQFSRIGRGRPERSASTFRTLPMTRVESCRTSFSSSGMEFVSRWPEPHRARDVREGKWRGERRV